MKVFTDKNSGYLYILPTIALFFIFVVVPFIGTIYLSLHYWNGLRPPEYLGFSNYIYIFKNPNIYKAFFHSIIFIIFYSILPILVSLTFAGIMTRILVTYTSIFRTILFIPQVIPSVVIGFAWIWMYGLDGPINEILRLLGCDGLARPWLGDFNLALIAIGFIGTWMTVGFTLVLFLAGVRKINKELFEAASIDGANRIQEFIFVTIPGIRQEILVAIIITTITALRTFDIIFVTTRGGPGTQTIVPGLFVYKLAFQEGRIGQACSVAVILSFIIFLIAYLITALVQLNGKAND